MAIKQTNDVQAQPSESAAANAAATEATVEKTTVVETAEAPVAEVEKAAAEPAATVEPEAATQAVEDRSAESESVLDEEEEEPAKEAPAAAAPTSNAVATQTGTTAVSTSRIKGAFLEQILKDLQEEGFEGVELDYSSFLNVILNKTIETSEGQELPAAGFLVRLAGSRSKFCFRNNNPVEDEVEVAYSYDRNADKDPESPVFAKIKEWKEAGLELDDVKEYQEVLAIMLDDKLEGEQAGELNGKLITIQVAPTSKGRWAGYLTQLRMGGHKNISDVKTLVRRGKKVESGKFPFYPWDFVCRGKIEADA